MTWIYASYDHGVFCSLGVTEVTEEKSEILTGSLVVYMARVVAVVMMGEKEMMGLVPVSVGVMGNEKERVKVRLRPER